MAVKVRERPKGSGVWWLFIDHRGQRWSKKIGRDKKLALDVAKKVEAQLALGHFNLDEEKPEFPRFKIMPRRGLTAISRDCGVIQPL
jgi:integrase